MNPGPWFPEPDRRRKNEPRGPEYDEGDESSFADIYNGFSFGSGRGRRKDRKREAAGERESKQPEQDDSRSAERERAREAFRTPPPDERPDASERSVSDFPPHARPSQGASTPGTPVPGQSTGEQHRLPPQQVPHQQVSGQQVSGQGIPEQQDAGADAEPPAEEYTVASSIRSYTWTGGRTKSNHQLEMETLVSTSETYRPGSLVRMEHQSIAEMCQHPRSVAEIGALLSVPIGVARVLLADMAELGLITVHQTVSESGSAPHLMLMERVLSGLRRL
ncbi:DUF742 domain-containing protein [Parasphingorhabdus pacifica]